MLRQFEIYSIYDNFEDSRMKCEDFLQNFNVEYSNKRIKSWSKFLQDYYYIERYEFELPDCVYQLFLKYLNEIDIDSDES